MKPRRLIGLDGLIERCPDCGTAVKAGGWIKDGGDREARVLMVLSYCRQCKKHIRTTYMFYERYSFSMSNRGQPENESKCYEAEPLLAPAT